MSDLQRFVDAQDHGTTEYGIFTPPLSKALEELRNGHKQEHWIWYVLPQIRHEKATKGPSIDFAISSLDEAVSYLKHEILRNRYLESTMIILGHLTSGLSDRMVRRALDLSISGCRGPGCDLQIGPLGLARRPC
ncbi:MAG: DUF1810 family protein [Actinobacteria bacterium]|nr:DUF1810 family protein [Actinomycetota bacterium]